jgi:hypothetical protein
MSNKCFVIQPISNTKFTKRYDDTYKPAINSAELEAYRVDLDPGVKIPIEEIESKIKGSIICFADISTDNPNVWYELGYAFALGKDVVMICDESRTEFPFDVRHKNIIRYKTESTSDFEMLKKNITAKLKAYLQSKKATEKIIESPIKETDGLQPYELTLLALIVGEQLTDQDAVLPYTLKEKMNEVGFNDIAFNIGMRKLKAKKLIDTTMNSDYNGNEYPICVLTDHGNQFILENTHLFDLEQKSKKEVEGTEDSLELPF